MERLYNSRCTTYGEKQALVEMFLPKKDYTKTSAALSISQERKSNKKTNGL
ncbi:hypothetical protein [Coleofasciculus sp. G2-EDA-02]|uniref:hypothetical protein n=1 Tax=Coleofasciculus sp. G2-EDA-02 TaxID=3069529 RepID=UPI0033001E2F